VRGHLAKHGWCLAIQLEVDHWLARIGFDKQFGHRGYVYPPWRPALQVVGVFSGFIGQGKDPPGFAIGGPMEGPIFGRCVPSKRRNYPEDCATPGIWTKNPIACLAGYAAVFHQACFSARTFSLRRTTFRLRSTASLVKTAWRCAIVMVRVMRP